MTGRADAVAPAPPPTPLGAPARTRPDHRGSWIPSGAMIATRFMELRKRRGLMITLILVTVGIPTVFLAIRLLLHAFAPKTYGPAGGYSIYTALVSGRAVRLRLHRGRHPGRHGRIRRPHRRDVPAPGGDRPLPLVRSTWLGSPPDSPSSCPLVAVGFTIVCAVCVFAAPTRLEFNGVNVPAQPVARRA